MNKIRFYAIFLAFLALLGALARGASAQELLTPPQIGQEINRPESLLQPAPIFIKESGQAVIEVVIKPADGDEIVLGETYSVKTDKNLSEEANLTPVSEAEPVPLEIKSEPETPNSEVDKSTEVDVETKATEEVLAVSSQTWAEELDVSKTVREEGWVEKEDVAQTVKTQEWVEEPDPSNPVREEA